MSIGGDFASEAVAAGFNFFTGVPCSYLTPVINAVLSSPGLSYVGAASEGEAVAIASGAALAGRHSVMMCQNSGLGNAVNPLTSLSHPFLIPTLLVTTWRGEPGKPDEPQHLVMGQITPQLIELMGLEQARLPRDRADMAKTLARAKARMDTTGLPFCLVMSGTGEAEPLIAPPMREATGAGLREEFLEDKECPTRAAVLERFLALVPDNAAVIASTGKCGRELFTLADRHQHLYQVGSMGCASGMGLGVALNVCRPVIVLDGDGALLMKLGSLATIGAYRPSNLVHILLDNGVHDSTGGQPTVSQTMDFTALALACDYRYAANCDNLDGFETALTHALAHIGPSFIRVRILPGSLKSLGRPTITPAEVAHRFKSFLASP